MNFKSGEKLKLLKDIFAIEKGKNVKIGKHRFNVEFVTNVSETKSLVRFGNKNKIISKKGWTRSGINYTSELIECETINLRKI
jgi:hypothetical protein